MSDQVANRPVSNLPSAAPGFVGRADSLERIRTGPAAHGRVVVHGPAGSGCTSLALEHCTRRRPATAGC